MRVQALSQRVHILWLRDHGVVYNMADQEQHHGKIPIPALPAKPRKPKRAKTTELTEEQKAAAKAASEEKKAARKERKRALEKTRVYIGNSFERWKQLKASKKLKTDAELALILLDR